VKELAVPTVKEQIAFQARASGHIVGLEVLRQLADLPTDDARLQFLDAIKRSVEKRFCFLCGAETSGKQCYCATCYDD
jgi:hypothetical protein